MRLKILKTILTIIIITITLESCKGKKVLIPETVTVPAKTLVTPNISLNTLFRNDSLVFVDTNNVLVVIKRDTVNRTIQVKARCPEEKVISKTEVIYKDKPVYKTNWLAMFLLLVLGYIFGALIVLILNK